MSQVVPLRVSIFEAAHNIAIKFAKADNTRAKAQSLRVEIGLELIDLQRRFEAGEARRREEPQEFWIWIKLRVDRSLRDMRKCIALAKAEDPEAAAAQEREDTRKAVSKHRAAKAVEERSYSKTPAQVVSIDPVERAIDGLRGLTAGFTEDERKRFLARALEEFPWLNTSRGRS